MRNFVTSVVFFSKTDGSGGSGVTRAVTFARLVGMWEHDHPLITLWLCVMSNTLLTWAPRLNAFGPAELEWFFSCRQDLFTHVDQLCCFDLDDSATKVTMTRAIDHTRRMFVTLQVWWVFFLKIRSHVGQCIILTDAGWKGSAWVGGGNRLQILHWICTIIYCCCVVGKKHEAASCNVSTGYKQKGLCSKIRRKGDVWIYLNRVTYERNIAWHCTGDA